MTTSKAERRPPSPNQGATVTPEAALGADQEDVAAWRARAGIDQAAHINLAKISHVRYGHRDLDAIARFLQDFGMRVVKKTPDAIYFGGYGPDQYIYVAEKADESVFLGGTFVVESFADLEKATKLPGASPIEEMKDAPGGGQRVVAKDPEGFPFALMYGQEELSEPVELVSGKLHHNHETEKARLGSFLRFKRGPSAVHKLGHYGLCVTDIQKQMDFYTRNFNLVPSDILHVTEGGERHDVAMFAHIDRGEAFVDHHAFFLSASHSPTAAHVHHSSFEVHDFDSQFLGHNWLKDNGYKPVWGVGRHIVGSQLFDYWHDTSSFLVEHYADGDLVNNKTPIGRLPAGSRSLAVWGPDIPADFLD